MQVTAKPSDAIRRMSINSVCKFLETTNLQDNEVCRVKNSIQAFIKKYPEKSDPSHETAKIL